MDRPESIHKIIAAQNRKLAHILKGADQLQLLQKQVEEHLPAELVGKLRIAGLERGKLFAHVDSPVWASRLRYCQANIVEQVSKTWGVNSLSISVCPLPPAFRKRISVQRPSDGASAEFLTDFAQDMLSNPVLENSLKRLARCLAHNPPDKSTAQSSSE